VRAEFPQVRGALPPPAFQRRRLWLDREQGSGGAEVVRGDIQVASLLNLEFVGNGHGAM
jgi:hypothetical protein